jgi:glycosyltransferase involved in cell wall biosynthesis
MIELVGHFKAELGVGEVARRLANLLTVAGIDTRLNVQTNVDSRQKADLPIISASNATTPSATIFCVNPDQMGQLFVSRAASLPLKGKTIGFWSWELESFPKKFAAAFSFVDEVWTVSDFARNSIQAATNKKVRFVKLPAIEPTTEILIEDANRNGIKEDDFVVLMSFDFFSDLRRKNPEAAIRAFMLAFPKVGQAKLLVKSINGHRYHSEIARLKQIASERSDILFYDGYLDPHESRALLARASIYLSLHRSEGLGLNIFDAIALGTPVVATGYSGNADFMNFVAAAKVPFGTSKVGFYAGLHHQCNWAEPDVGYASQKIRELYENEDLRMLTSANGQAFIQENYSYDAAIGHLRMELGLD